MIKRTRLGMIIRAGVDDRPMVEALGINVPIVFAATFFLGSLLAGMAGVLGGTMIWSTRPTTSSTCSPRSSS